MPTPAPEKLSDLTRVLEAMQRGAPGAADQFLAQVYEELRRLAAYRMAQERQGHTLQPTALVHEVWLRLVKEGTPVFEGRAHFFAAAGEAMRRILIEAARRKRSLKRGGGTPDEPLPEEGLLQEERSEEMLVIDEALDLLAAQDPAAANLVKLRYFVGMTMEEAATALGIPLRSAERLWAYARAWLRRTIAANQKS